MTAIALAQALWLLLAMLGLALSVSYGGLPVLGQGAFVAVGGVGTALLGPGGADLPLGLAALLAVTVAALLGYLLALGVGRLAAPFFALATWALGWLVYRALQVFPALSGGEQGLLRTTPARVVSPVLGTRWVLTPWTHVWLAGGLCLLTVLVLVRLADGPGGLDLAALRTSPELATSLGVPVAARRRALLAATAGLGAASGAGSLVLLGLVAPADVSPLLSLQLFVAVLLAGAARWWGPLLGVAVLTALPASADLLSRSAGWAPERSRAALTAALLVLVLALRAPVRRAAAALSAARRTDQSGPAGTQPVVALTPPAQRPAGIPPVGLQAVGLVVAYGALLALDRVDLLLEPGRVHALIGPNGSGKSTLLRVLAGDLTPSAGRVLVDGAPVAGTPLDRVRAGVARTPQRTLLPTGLAPARQVALGVRGGRPGRQAVLRALLATPSAARTGRADRQRVEAALARCGLTALAGTDPATLAVGDQRLLQVARVVATGATVLLLDEPAAGMTTQERGRLVAVLTGLAADGYAVLLVEHDMRLVRAVAHQVTVLAAGRVLAVGTPAAVAADPAVRAAYLGVAAP